jgi:ribosome-binding factor A
MNRKIRGSGRRARTDFDSFTFASDPRADRLSAQVCEALRLALALMDDPRLEDAWIRDVVPEGGSLVATVEVDAHDVPAVELALQRATPRLRSELATEVHRKRLPNLRFAVVPKAVAP